jgi:hypothetical protein
MVGPPGFEPESMPPRGTRMDQATLWPHENGIVSIVFYSFIDGFGIGFKVVWMSYEHPSATDSGHTDIVENFSWWLSSKDAGSVGFPYICDDLSTCETSYWYHHRLTPRCPFLFVLFYYFAVQINVLSFMG